MNYKNVKIAEGARIAKQSVILGNVTIGRDSCVLYYAVIRGDDAPVVIGEETNIQENCTIHVSHNMPVHIGNNVTVGHNAVIHGCTIGDRTLIGMGAVILDGAKIGNDCIIGAGSLVTKNAVIPDGSLVMGSPARIKRNLTWEEKLGHYIIPWGKMQMFIAGIRTENRKYPPHRRPESPSPPAGQRGHSCAAANQRSSETHSRQS